MGYMSEGRKRDALGRVEDVADQHVKRRLGGDVRSVPVRQTEEVTSVSFQEVQKR